jgi:hypothetical protein
MEKIMLLRCNWAANDGFLCVGAIEASADLGSNPERTEIFPY